MHNASEMMNNNRPPRLKASIKSQSDGNCIICGSPIPRQRLECSVTCSPACAAEYKRLRAENKRMKTTRDKELPQASPYPRRCDGKPRLTLEQMGCRIRKCDYYNPNGPMCDYYYLNHRIRPAADDGTCLAFVHGTREKPRPISVRPHKPDEGNIVPKSVAGLRHTDPIKRIPADVERYIAKTMTREDD